MCEQSVHILVIFGVETEIFKSILIGCYIIDLKQVSFLKKTLVDCLNDIEGLPVYLQEISRTLQ